MLFPALDFLDDLTPRSGPLNMAIDEVLARRAVGPRLRVYRWAEPWISIGYFGSRAEAACRWPGRPLVRRWTGGGEVPHGADFTYALIVPRGAGLERLPVRDCYRAIHAVLAAILPGAGLADSDARSGAACFERPVKADVMLGMRKVAGAAQRRGAFGLLHQGSVQGMAWPPDLGPRLARALADEVVEGELSHALLAEAEELAATRYATPAWLARH